MNAAWLAWPETQALIAAFSQQPDSLRFVGGCVRDAILQREVRDVDAATRLLPEQTMALLEKANIRAIPTGIAHGTVTALIGNRHFEITTLRKDTACDGRHAQVEYSADWQEDAARRDFTMNALYLSPQGELFDYFGGEDDARSGKVAFIGKPADRIAEDYLRILRFFRFFAHYGKSAPDAQALNACDKAAPHIEGLAAERVQQEMLKLLSAPKSYHAISFMAEQSVFAHTFGFALRDKSLLRRLEEMAIAFSQEISVAAKLAGLLRAGTMELDALSVRWKLSNALSDHARILFELVPQISTNLSFPEQKRLIRRYGAQFFSEAVLLVWTASGELIDISQPYHAMLMLSREWQAPAFPVTGKDLQTLGIKEGKGLGEQLRVLEAKWEESDYRLGKDELLAGLKA